MSYGVVNTDLITTSDGVSSAGLYGFKNKLINGDARIDQRNAGALVSSISSVYTLDRWLAIGSPTSKFTVQQNSGSVTPPAGFTNYLGVVSTSAYSVAAGDFYSLQQAIEGYNIADLAWGTASAAPITLSFWVRSSLTGTFGGGLRNASTNRSYLFTYTISAANTWEQKTVTIAGDTTGTWATNNTAGIYLNFSLGVGSTYSGTAGTWSGNNYFSPTGATSVVGTNGATFYITGVQLEKGSTATSFDYRPYGTELSLCQRYYQTYTNPPLKGVFAGTTNVSRAGMPIPNMRVAPTTTIGGSYNFFDGTTVLSGITTAAAIYATVNAVEVDFGVGTTGSGVTGRPAIGYVGSGFTSVINANAEF